MTGRVYILWSIFILSNVPNFMLFRVSAPKQIKTQNPVADSVIIYSHFDERGLSQVEDESFHLIFFVRFSRN